MKAIQEQIPAHWGEEYDAAIKAAIVEADKGVFYSKEVVFEWMDSWLTDNPLPMPEPDIFRTPK